MLDPMRYRLLCVFAPLIAIIEPAHILHRQRMLAGRIGVLCCDGADLPDDKCVTYVYSLCGYGYNRNYWYNRYNRNYWHDWSNQRHNGYHGNDWSD